MGWKGKVHVLGTDAIKRSIILLIVTICHTHMFNMYTKCFAGDMFSLQRLNQVMSEQLSKYVSFNEFSVQMHTRLLSC